MGVQPGLATKWEISADGKTVTLTLRDGVKFADGSAMTADDVKWSLDRARDPKAGAWSSSLASIDSIETSGGTVTLKLKNPDPTIIPALATFNAVQKSEQFLVSNCGYDKLSSKLYLLG